MTDCSCQENLKCREGYKYENDENIRTVIKTENANVRNRNPKRTMYLMSLMLEEQMNKVLRFDVQIVFKYNKH